MALPLQNQPLTSPRLEGRTRARVRRASVIVALSATATTAGCYAGPINSPPNPPDITVPDTIPRGQPTTLTAQATDPDDDKVTVSWYTGSGPCGADGTLPPGPLAVGPSYMLTPDQAAIDAGQVCVTVVATDR